MEHRTNSDKAALREKARTGGGRAITTQRFKHARRIPDDALHQEGRTKIASAALALFARHGYEATPVRAIAEAAGISVGSIFNYFPDKSEILRYILDESQAQIEQAVADAQEALAAGSGSDPTEPFRNVYRRFVESIGELRSFTLLAYQEIKALAREKRAPMLERERRILEVLKKAAGPAIEAGVFPADALDLKVHSLMVIGHAWAVRAWALTRYATVAHYWSELEPIAIGIMRSR